MTEFDIIAGLYVIPLAILFFCIAAVVLLIICFFYLRTNQQHQKLMSRTLEAMRATQLTIKEEMASRGRIYENYLQELNHEHELFERYLADHLKVQEKIDRVTSEIREAQSSYISKNSNHNAANGNKVKIHTGEKPTPEHYSAELVTRMISQLIDRMQDRNTPPKSVTRKK